MNIDPAAILAAFAVWVLARAPTLITLVDFVASARGYVPGHTFRLFRSSFENALSLANGIFRLEINVR